MVRGGKVMLFTTLKGLFFLEQRLKGTMVWFLRVSSAGRSGAFRGGTQNRAESQPSLGWVLRREAERDPFCAGASWPHVDAESWVTGQSCGARGSFRAC